MDARDDRHGAVPHGSSTVVVHLVTDVDAQQRVLADFRTAAIAGVGALGTQHRGSTYVVARCAGVLEEELVEDVVAQLDPGARRVRVVGDAPDRRAAAPHEA